MDQRCSKGDGIKTDIQVLKDTLSVRDYRLTAPRMLLLEALIGMPEAFTVEEVKAIVPLVGRATVFRTVKLLLELGVLCKIAMENGTPRYCLATGSHHHHLICVACGSSRDFGSCTVDEEVLGLQLTTGFRVLTHRIEVYGVCDVCQISISREEGS